MKHYRFTVTPEEAAKFRSVAENSPIAFVPSGFGFTRVGNGKYKYRATYYCKRGVNKVEQFRVYYN